MKTSLPLSVLCLALLAVAVFGGNGHSTPQPEVEPFAEPAVAVAPAQPAPIVEYKPAVVTPAPKGHHELRWIEGAFRWVWFSDNVPKTNKKNPAQPVASKPVYSSGGCANGQCSRGWGRRGR